MSKWLCMKTFHARVKCRKPHTWTYKQHAESNTLVAHKRNCLLLKPTSMHAPRAPRREMKDTPSYFGYTSHLEVNKLIWALSQHALQ